MIIKEIEFNNFRIYKGKNRICLTPEDGKNIIVVSGNNGFGKTTFLMALVWCLYGKQMEKVDELYKREIYEKGGYGRYIGNSLNYQAEKEGETRFSVSITFSQMLLYLILHVRKSRLLAHMTMQRVLMKNWIF